VSVFPSIPSHWADLSFAGLRAEGAFLVDAVREKGITAMIRVKSEKGGPCVIETDIPAADVSGPGDVSSYLGRTRISVETRPGDEIVIRNKRSAKAEPGPVEFKRFGETYFGLNRFSKYSNDQKFNW
jgi:hypothetical protein